MSGAGEVQVKDDDIDDDLRAAITSLKGGEEATQAHITIDKPEKIVARDEGGKFAPKEEAEKAQPKERETLKLPAEKVAANGGAETVAPLTPAVKAPITWKGDAQSKFAELPDWAQAEINRRETDMQKQFTRQDEERLLGKKINEMANPCLPTIRAEGATVEKAFADCISRPRMCCARHGAGETPGINGLARGCTTV